MLVKTSLAKATATVATSKQKPIMKPLNLEEVARYIQQTSPETKIYLGVDSERVKLGDRWYADYTLAIVVHIDGKHGCKVFGEVQREPDWSQSADKPSMRLMQEVYKVSELFTALSPVLEDRYVEVHLDINPAAHFKSNQVVQQAVGYIRGTCNITPQIKPNAFAASYAADRLKFVLSN
jgi:uncharacterized protein